ncbi:thioesterase family protein [Duganella radicis]|uniref:Thioesterase n=1 Tax=Duganella radicis TaxID=551988 RepID=A0A6L6PGZ9_9BURK|nr:thioesterase family protein [Duganella radicis]MTV37575.1 hypothetical protein [Duganella radicis]
MISMISEARARFLYDYGVQETGQDGGDIIFRISRPRDGKLVAMAKYGFVFFNYRSGQVTPMPPEFLAKFPKVNRLD